ncbi:MAG: hypothetical protein IID46_08790 [Planctomycetes bacterium]|nr:hypothetical protein [Planctomycetota bacterium]
MRKVIRHREFESQLDELSHEYGRVDEFVRGIEWVLSRDPEAGTLVNRCPLTWFIPAPDVYDLPFGVSYTFNETHIYLLSIWVSEDDPL